MSGDINAPICIDDDDEDDHDLKIDEDYKLLLDNLRDRDNSLGILLEDDNGESETREFDMCRGDSKRSKLENANQINKRVSQQRKRKAGFDGRSVAYDTTRQNIQRDNRRAERRKRNIAELEASRAIPLARKQEKIQRDDKARKMSESKVETLRDVPLVRTLEVIQRNNKVRKVESLETLRDVPLVRTQEDIQRDSQARKISESKVETLRDVPLVFQRDNKARKMSESKESKLETLRDVPLVRTQEVIQRDSNLRKFVGLEVETLRDVPLVRIEEDIQRESKVGRVSESKLETLRDVPLVRTQEKIQRDSKARKMSESKVETLRNVPLIRTQEVIQRDSKARRISESKVQTLRDVPLVRTQEVIERDNRVRKFVDLKVETLRASPSATTEEDIRRDNRIAEQRKKKIAETRAAGTSNVVPAVERINRVTELKAVEKTSRSVPVSQSDKRVVVGTRNKNEEESAVAVDKDYMRYLIWLVDSLIDSTAEPDVPSDLDPPVIETQKDSTIVPEEGLLVKVKAEPDLESWSDDDDDDDDIIAISDFPFPDGEGTPFVASKSKSVIDLEKESAEDESSSCFRRKLMDVLKKPYNETELLMLSGRASVKRPVTRCRELRKGRESNYETDELGDSYLEQFPDFDEEYKRVEGDDREKLELLRGFFFFLENVSQVGAFKPWIKK